MKENTCERCGLKFLPYEKVIHLQDEPVEIICSECFNAEAAIAREIPAFPLARPKSPSRCQSPTTLLFSGIRD